ncbi:MAG: BamA/TamA family outer membrane protein [bacterium]|nr:BamA/TamA family outer membrane protein [bacterium]
MTNTLRRILPGSLLTLFLLAVCLASQASAFPRDVKWKQVKTEHFRIIYPERHRIFVPHIAGTIESVDADMSRFFEYDGERLTDVVLTDHIDSFDRFNLEVVRSPGALLVLHLGDMSAGAPSFDMRVSDWLLVQFIYQYTNILRHNMDSRFRHLFSFAYQDVGFSGWMDGGMALYMLTHLGEGQARSPYLDMFIRSDLLEASLEEIANRAATGYAGWPGDIGLFLYGYSFLRHLSEQYGAERLAELNRVQSKELPTPLEKDVFQEVYGKKYKDLRQDWLSELLNSYGEQIQQIQTKPLTHSQPLSESGYFSGSPLFSPDGDYVYYIEDSPHDRRALVQLRLSDREKRRLTEGNFSGSFSISSDGQSLYFCKTDIYQAYYQRSDLYALDVSSKKLTRLTRGARAFDPEISPDGSTLVYVTIQAEQMELKQMDLNGGEHSILWTASDYAQIRQPAFSADGRQLALQISELRGSQDIYIMNRDGSQLRPIFKDAAIDASPSWGLGDTHLFFHSDRTGVPNIFAYNLETGLLYQVGNVLSGNFDPVLSNDAQSILFTEYSSKGMNVHFAQLAQEQWRRMSPGVSQHAENRNVMRFQPGEIGDETRYNALSSLIPSAFPVLGGDEEGLLLGLNLGGGDKLGRHKYSLSLLYGLESNRMAFDAEYVNEQFFPTIGIVGYDRAVSYSDLFLNPQGGSEDYWERQQGGGIEIGIPLFRSLRSDLYITARYDFLEVSRLTKKEDLWQPLPDEGSLGNASSRIIWRSFERSRFSISPEAGFLTSVRYRRYDEIFGSDFNIHEATGDLNLYLNLPFQHHVLFLRGAGGISDGDTLQQGLFQIGGYLLDFETELIYEPKFHLRGYESTAYSGDRFVLGTVEYRFPLWYVQKPTLNGLLFWNSIAGNLFVDAGHAWKEESAEMDLQYSVGGELNLNIAYRYGRMPLGLRVGVAHGFDEELGETQLYFKFRLNL